jgi:NADPH-dependent 2,4-dienoyl-CoA reductase/sulfur reductase-like enzyme/nitrite reductase/ring-hydroxylating ferredoxin subunit
MPEQAMTDEEKPPSGPDLSAGVAISQIPDGGMLLGHVGDEAALFARRGEEIFAIGATCTHYGGPLAEGLLVGDTVRCPWHHACFGLRDGENLRPPALNPVTSWKVIREGDRVRAGEKNPPPPPVSKAPHADTHPESVVIIGAGPAGLVAAQTLRREGYSGPVRLFGAEATSPVDRPNLSKDFLAGKAPEDWIPLRPSEFYETQKLELRTGVAATAIDPKQRRVSLDDGSSISFGALLLATGAEPIRLDIPGGLLPHVHYLRTLADSRGIIAAAGSARRVVVVGAGFIGLEVAASLRERGLEVHVVTPDARPLERILGAEAGDYVRGLHESHGVVFHFGQTASAISDREVELASRGSLPADLVVVGIGVRPSTSLAEKAGLRVDKGIVVDEYFETSAKGIFAAGDAARYPDFRTGQLVRIEHFVAAERQGQAAARNMLGTDRREAFRAVPFFWSQHYDVVLNYVGHAEQWDAMDRDGTFASGSCRVTYKSGGKTLAVLTLSRDRESLEAEAAMEGGASPGF